MYSLLDVRKDESKVKDLSLYLNAFILFLLSLTVYSYVFTLNPLNLNKPKARVTWLTIGLISNCLAGGIATQKLSKVEKKIDDIEKDADIFEKNNRHLLLSTSNHYYQQSLMGLGQPTSQEKEDPLLTKLLEQAMSIPIVGENQQTESITQIPQETTPIPAMPLIENETSFTTSNTVLMPQKQVIDNGLDIIEQASATSLSTVFSSPPGTGKTVTLLAWLQKLVTKFPEVFVTVVAQKNDSFLGLNSIGAVTVFDGIDTLPISQAINETFEILQFRKSQTEETRQQLRSQPVWLILDDWFSMFEVLKKDKKLWSELSAKIATIVTVGREFNVAIAVTTHSFNIASLGLAGDSNIRSCLNIMSLGFISKDEYGRKQGGFDAINSILNNNSIISKEYREGLKLELEKLIVESNRQSTPVIFTTMGHPPRLALLPNLLSIKNYQIPQEILFSIKGKLEYIRGKENDNFPQEENPISPLEVEVFDGADDIYELVEKEEKRVKVIGLIKQGIREKTKIIKEVWGVSGGRAYQKANQELEEILNNVEL